MSKGSVADVTFADGSRASGLEQARLLQAEYAHERAVVTVDDSSPTSARFKTGAPVLIEWGSPPTSMRHFIGYVDHVQPIHSPLSIDERGGASLMRVVCVGATWSAKGQAYRTFRNVAGTNVITQIARENRFDTRNVGRSAWVEPVLHQSGKTDWEFMVDCAKKAGWTLFSRGLAIHCTDRRKLIEQSISRAPLLRSSATGGSVLSFRPLLGANTPKGGNLAKRTGFGMNPRSGALLVARDARSKPLFNSAPIDPVLAEAQTGMVFESMGEAAYRMAAEERRNRLSITAELVASASSPGARVGAVVAVSGFGVDDGYWYVTEADHEINKNGKSKMTLQVGRDTVRPLADDVRSWPVSSYTPGRSARLLNGKWVTA